MATNQLNKLEQRLSKLELVALTSMKESVVDFYRRVPSGPKSKPRWIPAMYPKGSEKELYAEFTYILLSAPHVMIPALFQLLQVPLTDQFKNSSMLGRWRAYRLSTIRLELGSNWTGPMCFPGAAGHGGIADVGLFLNPSYDEADGKQIQADVFIYFEIKSSDYHSHKISQLQAHLEAIEEEIPFGIGFLAAVGGKQVRIEHPQWLGHVTLNDFLQRMYQVAILELANSSLAAEIEELQLRKSC